MMTSVQTTPTVSTLKQRARPGLKLNVTQKTFEDENILINRNTTASYVIQNHPKYTDQNEFSYSTQKKYGQIFFAHNSSSPSSGDESHVGDFYYVVQKANGKEMQDKHKIRNSATKQDVSFFGVYDGHTTHLIADLLARKLDDCIFENLENESDMILAIKQAFATLENEVMSGLQDHRPRGGSTALCSVLHNHQIYSANLGDSRAVVFKGREFVALSNLHDFSNESERNFAEQKGGTLFKNRLEGELAVSRSIGDINFKAFMNSEPEIQVYEITEDDEYLFIGTDGFWNGLNPEQCLTKLQEFPQKESSNDLEELGNFLIEEAKNNIKIKKDNMTLIIVDLKGYLNKKKKNNKSSKFF